MEKAPSGNGDAGNLDRRSTHILRHSRSLKGNAYLAFPTIVDFGSEVVVAYKRGSAHCGETSADVEMLRYDGETNTVTGGTVIDDGSGYVNQNPEFVTFPDGRVSLYIDRQEGGSTTRTGLQEYRSTDDGETFSYMDDVGAVDGVEYGYSFDAAIDGEHVYMLTMTFPELSDLGRSVHVLQTTDNGRTWTHSKNLTDEFGTSINESSIVPYDGTFLICTRGDDGETRLHRTDGGFNELRSANLTAKHRSITGYIGRPRTFERDGDYFLMGRNFPPGDGDRGDMTLELFRVDPASLAIADRFVLDSPGPTVGDGYYAQHYFRGDEASRTFHVITYRGLDHRDPSIVQFDYEWNVT